LVIQKRKLLSVALVVSAFASSGMLEGQPASAKADHGADVSVAEEHVNHKPYQVVRTTVKAKPEQVWQVLTDYTSAPKIFPTLRKCHVLSESGNTKRVHYQIHPTGSISKFQYELELRETPHKSIEWRRLSGDFKEVDGYWRLEPADGGRSTVVTYASHVNGGMFLPQALIKRQVRIDLPQVMTALKSHAETTTQIAVRGTHSSHGHSN
jgi:ribosome-associated toxin RatA of RatAB toxin-antitoxin module